MKREQQCVELSAFTKPAVLVMTGKESFKDIANLAQKNQGIESVFLLQRDCQYLN